MNGSSRIAALVAVMLGALLPVWAEASAEEAGVDQTCVLALTKTDPALVNTAYPDEQAIYWIGAYAAVSGTRIRLQGDFPHARYMSFNVYDNTERPLDVLTDVNVAPEPGSSNPFLPGARRDVKSRSYTTYIEFGPKPANPADRAPNTLYTGTGQPVGETATPNYDGTFIYRIYIPDNGAGETGGVGIPTATLQASDGGPAPRSACANFQKPSVDLINQRIAGSDADIPQGPFGGEPVPRWRKSTNTVDIYNYYVTNALGLYDDRTKQLGGSGGFLSNIDNAYVTALIQRNYGQVVVARFRAPTFPQTRDGQRRMRDAQLRYFSMCQNQRNTQRYVACAADDQTVIGKDGFVTYVVSTPSQRPRFATAACGVTWMPWGPTDDGALIYRNMLPNPQFAQAIQFAKADHEVETMGDYLPVSRYFADKAAYDTQVGCTPSKATTASPPPPVLPPLP